MIVSKGNDGYVIIMADSATSEVVIKLKEEAARDLRNRLDLLLPKTELEGLFEDMSYKDPATIKVLGKDIEVGLCKLKHKFCEHALRKDDGTKSGYYPNNDQIGNGCCGGEYCE